MRYLTKQQQEIAERLMSTLNRAAHAIPVRRSPEDNTPVLVVDLAAVRQLIEQALRDSFAAGAAHALETVPTQIVVTPEQFAEIYKHADGPVPAVWPFAPPAKNLAHVEFDTAADMRVRYRPQPDLDSMELADRIRTVVGDMHDEESALIRRRRPEQRADLSAVTNFDGTPTFDLAAIETVAADMRYRNRLNPSSPWPDCPHGYSLGAECGICGTGVPK